jgi:hypothetical protein
LIILVAHLVGLIGDLLPSSSKARLPSKAVLPAIVRSSDHNYKVSE